MSMSSGPNGQPQVCNPLIFTLIIWTTVMFLFSCFNLVDVFFLRFIKLHQLLDQLQEVLKKPRKLYAILAVG